MAESQRPLDTYVTLVLEDADPALAEAHRDLYPERIPEQIPLSPTLLYPWISRDSLTDDEVDELRSFFAITREQARRRVEPLLPVRCDVTEATLTEEYEPDRFRVLAGLPFGRS